MGEIIQLSAKPDDIKPSLPIKREKICIHKTVEVDIDERELRCRQCNAKVDPFEFVLSLAYEERTQIYTLKEIKRQIETLRKDKDQLQKDVASLKSQKRRLA